MDFEDKIRELGWLEHQIRISDNNKKRVRLLQDYLNLLYFLSDVYPEKIDFMKKYDDLLIYMEKRNNYIEKEKDIFLQDYYNNLENLISLNNKMLKVILDNKLIFKHQSLNCNKDDCNEIFKEFVNLDTSLKKAFTSVVNNIYISPFSLEGNTTGYCSCSNYAIKPNILISNDLQTYSFYCTIAHEFGHAYEAILTDTLSPFIGTNLLKAEISSKLFERIYNNLVPKGSNLSKVKDNYYISYRFTLQEQIICQDIISLINKSGDVYCDYNGNVEVDIEDYINDYNSELLNFPSFQKPSFYNYSYIIGDIISNNFVKYYGDNYQLLLKEFRNLLMNLPYMRTEDLINEYCNIDATKEEVERVCKYQKKLYHI